MVGCMNRNEQFFERIVLLVMMAGFGALLYTALNFKSSFGSAENLSSMAIPVCVLSLVLVLCAIRLAMNLLAWAKSKGGQWEKTDRRVYISTGLIVLYALLWNPLGFCLSTGLFLLGIFQVLRPNKQSLAKDLLLSVAVTAGIYLLFGKGFPVYFPGPPPGLLSLF